MDRDDLIRRANKAVKAALARPRLAGLDSEDVRALKGLKLALEEKPEIADLVLPYVDRQVREELTDASSP